MNLGLLRRARHRVTGGMVLAESARPTGNDSEDMWMTAIDAHDAKPFEQALMQRAHALRAETQEVRAELADAANRDRTNEVEDTAEQAETRARTEVRTAEQRRDTEELEAIDAALQRIAAGSYGQCLACGRAIPLARLQAQPAAARCIECQQRLEQDAATGDLHRNAIANGAAAAR